VRSGSVNFLIGIGISRDSPLLNDYSFARRPIALISVA